MFRHQLQETQQEIKYLPQLHPGIHLMKCRLQSFRGRALAQLKPKPTEYGKQYWVQILNELTDIKCPSTIQTDFTW